MSVCEQGVNGQCHYASTTPQANSDISLMDRLLFQEANASERMSLVRSVAKSIADIEGVTNYVPPTEEVNMSSRASPSQSSSSEKKLFLIGAGDPSGERLRDTTDGCCGRLDSF